MRAGVPECSPLSTPRRAAERVVGSLQRAEPAVPGAAPAGSGPDPVEPCPGSVDESVGEEHHGRDATRLDRGLEFVRGRDVERDRLIEQEMLPGSGGVRRHARLDRGWHGEGHRLHVAQQDVDVGVGRGVQALRERGRPGCVTAPHADELSVRTRQEPRPVCDARPWTGADQADASQPPSVRGECRRTALPAAHQIVGSVEVSTSSRALLSAGLMSGVDEPADPSRKTVPPNPTISATVVVSSRQAGPSPGQQNRRKAGRLGVRGSGSSPRISPPAYQLNRHLHFMIACGRRGIDRCVAPRVVRT